MHFQIITDTCCDFTAEQYRNMDVISVPLSVMWDGEAHSHFSEKTSLRNFYSRMRGGLSVSTSALNPADWSGAMEPLLRQGRDLLVLTVSSGISATHQSACIAAADLREQYPERTIHVADSLSGSLGEGLLLWHACRLRDQGISPEDTLQWIQENSRRVCHWVTVQDLSHLSRSGRLSSAGAFLGNMLNVKPIIKVTEAGTLVSDGKIRGRAASIQALAKRFGQFRDPASEDLVTIAHGDCPEDAETLAKILQEEYGVRNIHTGYVGPILGAHTGPGVLGLFHLGTSR